MNQIDYWIVWKMFIEVVFLCLALDLQNFKTGRDLRDHPGQTFIFWMRNLVSDQVRRLHLVFQLASDKARTASLDQIFTLCDCFMQ